MHVRRTLHVFFKATGHVVLVLEVEPHPGCMVESDDVPDLESKLERRGRAGLDISQSIRQVHKIRHKLSISKVHVRSEKNVRSAKKNVRTRMRERPFMLKLFLFSLRLFSSVSFFSRASA